MQQGSSQGRIVAFCSPKGGVGRSTAVANVAWVLATSGRRVLVVDWDLETPSLHEFFRPFLLDPELASTEGVMDAVSDFAPLSQSTPPAEPDLLRHAVSLDWSFPPGGALDFLSAGRQSPAYAVRVAQLDWKRILDGARGDLFVRSLQGAMRSEYDIVLIDLHCGLTDAGRICAGRLADAVVVCFTLAASSIEAARTLAEEVRGERGHATGEFFPVPMRVDPFEKELLERGRRHARDAFAPFVSLTGPEYESYWADVEVAYFPFYAYSEVLAPFGDRPGSANSVLAAAERLASRLAGRPIGPQVYASPEVSQQVIAKYTGQPLA